MNTVGRATRPEPSSAPTAPATLTGGRGLLQHEPLLFEVGGWDKTGVDLPDATLDGSDLGDLLAAEPVALPGLSEPETLRHYVRLSQQNHAIDLALYPLGSCTMKHNPRLNEKAARYPGFSDIHPLQPQSTVQGALQLMDRLAHWLKTLTGMPAVALTPKAGAHGELCGLQAIRAAHRAAGHGLHSEHPRRIVLTPTSAHGTNPATAAFVGYEVREIGQTADGHVDLDDLAAKLSPEVAAIMVTNPNTCGLFERDIVEIARLTHEAGAYFYCDGANFNAIVGRVRPGDLGVDAMHINLHKTFSTPHGGGGPGAGPVVFSEALAPFAPVPWIVHDDNGFSLVEEQRDEAAQAFGRMCAFHGQMGMFVRAYAYMLSHGADGLRQVAEDAVLNANYLKARLSGVMSPAFPDGPCMHEALFSDAWLDGTGVTTLDFAKAMIDEGFHPMTMYFPLVVHGAMLIEPTETESKAELDRFADALIALAGAAKAGGADRFKQAPLLAPLRRLDETAAARKPKLRWKPEPLQRAAAERGVAFDAPWTEDARRDAPPLLPSPAAETGGSTPRATSPRPPSQSPADGKRRSESGRIQFAGPELRSFLVGVARRRATVTYGEVATAFGFAWSQGAGVALTTALDRLGVENNRRGEPLLMALVVSKGSGAPGIGFYRSAGLAAADVERHGRELDRLWLFAWPDA